MGIGGGSWSWILVCSYRRSSGCQLHLDWVVVTDCQGLQEGKRLEMFNEPLTPHSAAGAHRAVNALPESSACWRGNTVPSPETLDTQGSHGEVARCDLGWALGGCPLPSEPPWLIWGLCASDRLLKVGLS